MERNGGPYHSLDYELGRQLSQRIYKLSLDGGIACPGRDGTLGIGGCIFYNEGDSSDFAAPGQTVASRRIEQAMAQIKGKVPDSSRGSYVVYFQSYTNTYTPLPCLGQLFGEAVPHPTIAVLSTDIKPDCLEPEITDLLRDLNRVKPVWVELGPQTIHDSTSVFIRRGCGLSVFEDALRRFKSVGLIVIVYVILGLPSGARDMIAKTMNYLAQRSTDGIKLQPLHTLRGAGLAGYSQANPFPVFIIEKYTDFVIDCVECLPPKLAIHHLTGDGPESPLLTLLRSGSRRLVLDTLHHRFKERDTWQGKYYIPDSSYSAVFFSPDTTIPSPPTVTPQEMNVMYW